MTWTPAHDAAYRVEVERRFRARTPATTVLDGLPSDRVQRGELRNWAIEHCGMLPPETDRAWILAHARWYRRMARRVLLELDPEALAAYRPWPLPRD